MDKIFDKVKAAGLGTVVVALGAWLVSATTNWLRFKGIPEDVVVAISLFVGGLVATVAAYLKTEHTGTPTVRNERGQSAVVVLLIIIVVIALIFLLGGRGIGAVEALGISWS